MHDDTNRRRRTRAVVAAIVGRGAAVAHKVVGAYAAVLAGREAAVVGERDVAAAAAKGRVRAVAVEGVRARGHAEAVVLAGLGVARLHARALVLEHVQVRVRLERDQQVGRRVHVVVAHLERKHVDAVRAGDLCSKIGSKNKENRQKTHGGRRLQHAVKVEEEAELARGQVAVHDVEVPVGVHVNGAHVDHRRERDLLRDGPVHAVRVGLDVHAAGIGVTGVVVRTDKKGENKKITHLDRTTSSGYPSLLRSAQTMPKGTGAVG